MKRKNCLKYILTISIIILLNTPNKVYAQNIDKLYEKIDLFGEVLEKIQDEYVEEVDQVEIMEKLGFESYHVVGHDRGARVGHRLTLDNASKVRSFTSLDVVPSETAFKNMNSDLSFAWFHWHLMRQPYPLPETLIGNSAKTYLDFLFETWTAVENAITPEAYKDVDAVVNVSHELGIATKVAKLVPIGVIKG